MRLFIIDENNHWSVSKTIMHATDNPKELTTPTEITKGQNHIKLVQTDPSP